MLCGGTTDLREHDLATSEDPVILEPAYSVDDPDTSVPGTVFAYDYAGRVTPLRVTLLGSFPAPGGAVGACGGAVRICSARASWWGRASTRMV